MARYQLRNNNNNNSSKIVSYSFDFIFFKFVSGQLYILWQKKLHSMSLLKDSHLR